MHFQIVVWLLFSICCIAAASRRLFSIAILFIRKHFSRRWPDWSGFVASDQRGQGNHTAGQVFGFSTIQKWRGQIYFNYFLCNRLIARYFHNHRFFWFFPSSIFFPAPLLNEYVVDYALTNAVWTTGQQSDSYSIPKFCFSLNILWHHKTMNEYHSWVQIGPVNTLSEDGSN